MGKRSGISWTDSTWNPIIGCRKVSRGCTNCYAERWVEDRMGRKFTDIVRARNSTFIAPLKWGPLEERTWPGFPTRRVFTCSLSDFFIEEMDTWRDQAWDIIRKTPHVYQILTKRPERIPHTLPSDWGDGWPNVWLGTSVEDQKYAEIRIPQLVAVPARVHFLSCEPLLGPIDFDTVDLGYDPILRREMKDDGWLEHVEWVICGGESGPGFRPMDLDWARSIRDQCVAADVPFFFKQSSGPRSEMNPVLDRCEWRQFPGQAAIH